MDTAGGRTPLLDRRCRPGMDVNIAKPIKPKLRLDIPPSSARVAEFVSSIARNSSPALEDGVVNTGSFDSGHDETEEERRGRSILALQTSGDKGRNDYLHWYTEHPQLLPQKHNDVCPCQDGNGPERWIDYGVAVKILFVIACVNAWSYYNRG